jgi:sulfoxide reductase heme-binding subunit YedZ
LNRILTSKWTKLVVFLLSLVPVADISLRVASAELAEPVKFIEHQTGDWTLIFLVITLAITPLRKILRMPLLVRFRRMFGLFAFLYVSLHLTTWILLDHWQAWNWNAIWADLLKRPFIAIGFTGFVLLVPLAITSTAGWIRRLGGKRWRMLHRALYITAVLSVIHYYWLVKSDKRAPLAYGAAFAVLLFWRIGDWFFERRRAAAERVRGKASVSTESA